MRHRLSPRGCSLSRNYQTRLLNAIQPWRPPARMQNGCHRKSEIAAFAGACGADAFHEVKNKRPLPTGCEARVLDLRSAWFTSCRAPRSVHRVFHSLPLSRSCPSRIASLLLARSSRPAHADCSWGIAAGYTMRTATLRRQFTSGAAVADLQDDLQGSAPHADGARPIHGTFFPGRGDSTGRRTSALRGVPPRRLCAVQRILESDQPEKRRPATAAARSPIGAEQIDSQAATRTSEC